ncbi:MAG: J domain-containing protein [Blastocatellia bacterium]
MNLTALESPYKILGVERTASESEIKQAYFALVREHPPERDPEGFKRIRVAYEKLRAGGERAETDLFLIEEMDDVMSAEKIERYGVEPPEITPDLIRSDLIALEAVLLMEEAISGHV